MESGKPVMYAAPAGGYYYYYAPPAANYGGNQQHLQRVEAPAAPALPPTNPYVFHEPDCRYSGVSPERRRRNSVANALAAAFIVCWCCTWPCHGPCCCGL